MFRLKLKATPIGPQNIPIWGIDYIIEHFVKNQYIILDAYN